jgi:hypothetical protein
LARSRRGESRSVGDFDVAYPAVSVQTRFIGASYHIFLKKIGNAYFFSSIGKKVRDGEDVRHCLVASRPHAGGQVGSALPGIRSYRDAIRDSRIAAFANKLVWGAASHEWLFRWRFAQSRVAQLGLVPTLAVFASRSAISTPLRFAIKLFRSRHVRSLRGNAPAANLCCRT